MKNKTDIVYCIIMIVFIIMSFTVCKHFYDKIQKIDKMEERIEKIEKNLPYDGELTK